MVERLFLAVLRGCLQFVIVVFPDHTHLLFLGSHHTFELKMLIQGYTSVHGCLDLRFLRTLKCMKRVWVRPSTRALTLPDTCTHKEHFPYIF